MKNISLQSYFFPMLVSSVSGQEDSTKEILSRWAKFDLLKEEEKNILTSEDVPNVIDNISKEFNLTPIAIAEIARLIREVYFKNISKVNLPQEVMKKIPSLTISNAQRISQIINEKIFTLKLQTKEEVESEKMKADYITMNLGEALQKYPSLGEQAITTDQIKLKYFPDPAKPSIKNWITDFHDSMGGGKHGAIDRGNFLFHGENGRKLSAEERQKVSLVLKSLDDESLLAIDPEKQIVVFSDIEKSVEIPETSEEKAAMLPEMDVPQKMDVAMPPVAMNAVAHIGSSTVDDKGMPSSNDLFKKFAPREKETARIYADDFAGLPVGKKLGSENFSEQPQEARDVFQKYEKKGDFLAPRKNLSPNFANMQSMNVLKAQDFPQQTAVRETQPLRAENFSSVVSLPNRPHIVCDNTVAEKNVSQPQKNSEVAFSFSSPQQLPVEQEIQETHGNTKIVQPQMHRAPRNAFHISPSGYFGDKSNNEEKKDIGFSE